MSLPIDAPGLIPIDTTSARVDAAQRRAAGHPGNVEEAAEQFEGLLIQQLWKTMRQTVRGGLLGDLPGHDTYLAMVDQAVSEQLARDGGVGLHATLTRAFGGPQTAAGTNLGSTEATLAHHRAPAEPATGARLAGAMGRVQQVAEEMLDPVASERWSHDGRLTPDELTSRFALDVPGGVARFNVNDAAGYHGYYKCNLFALEMARRAGFEVPLVARARGFSYPSPDSISEDAADGTLRASWGRVATGESADTLESAIESGRRAFLLSASGHDGHAGHMGVVERIHEVDYDDFGEVRRVVFDGWEARRDGARHLTQRTWNVRGNPGGANARNGLHRIELIELLPAQGRGAEVPLSSQAGPSVRDR